MKTINKNDFLKYFISIFLIVTFTTISIKAWNGLIAENGDKLSYDKWNQLVATVQSGTPSGAVMAFDLPTCPTGWTEYTNARGRTIIGAGNGAGSTTAVGDTGGEKSAPNIKLFFTTNTTAQNIPGSPNTWLGSPSSAGVKMYAPAGGSLVEASGLTGGGTATDNMQPYVSLLYCRKN